MKKDEKRLEETFKRAEELGVFDELKKIHEDMHRDLRKRRLI